MPIKPDLRVHGRELESLLQRVADLEEAQGPTAFASATSVSETPWDSIAAMNVRLEQMETAIADRSVRLDDIECSLNDVSTIGPKKLAIKFGARLDALDERLQAIEAGVKL